MEEKPARSSTPLVQRVVAYLIIIAAVLLTVKLFAGFFIGVAQVIFTIVLVVVIVFGVLWAVKRL